MNFNSELAVHVFLESDLGDTDAAPLPVHSPIQRVDSFSVKSNRVAFADLLAKSIEQENAPPPEFTTLHDMFPDGITVNKERFFENPLVSGKEPQDADAEKEERRRRLKGLAGSFNSFVSLISRKVSNEEPAEGDDNNVGIMRSPGQASDPLARPSLRKTWSAKALRSKREEEPQSREIPYYTAVDENRRSRRRLRRSSLTFANIGSLFRTSSSTSLNRDLELSRSSGRHLSRASPSQDSRRSKSSFANKRSTMSEQSVPDEEDARRRTRFTITLFKREQ